MRAGKPVRSAKEVGLGKLFRCAFAISEFLIRHRRSAWLKNNRNYSRLPAFFQIPVTNIRRERAGR
jgi:hypothetical protein